MAAWTLEQAKKHLEAWMEAEIAVTTGQSYTLRSRQLTRANLSDINKQIQFWANEVNKLEAQSKRRGTNCVYRVVPRDL